jgi:cytochrome c oxidase subunit 4
MSAHVSMRTYVLVFVALLFLTLLTLFVAFIPLGRLNDVVALTIATTKALLVLIFFMHLRDSPALMRLSVAAGMFWLITLIALSMSDVLSREWLPVIGR